MRILIAPKFPTQNKSLFRSIIIRCASSIIIHTHKYNVPPLNQQYPEDESEENLKQFPSRSPISSPPLSRSTNSNDRPMLDPRDRISRLNSKRSIFQMPASGVNRGLFWVCRTACRTRTHHPSIIRWINYRPPAHTATHPSTTTPLNRHVQAGRIYHVGV